MSNIDHWVNCVAMLLVLLFTIESDLSSFSLCLFHWQSEKPPFWHSFDSSHNFSSFFLKKNLDYYFNSSIIYFFILILTYLFLIFYTTFISGAITFLSLLYKMTLSIEYCLLCLLYIIQWCLLSIIISLIFSLHLNYGISLFNVLKTSINMLNICMSEVACFSVSYAFLVPFSCDSKYFIANSYF